MNEQKLSQTGLFGRLENFAQRDNSQPGDYTENGVRICGKCHTPKQKRIRYPVLLPTGDISMDAEGKPVMKPRLVTVTCLCEEEAVKQKEAEYHNQDEKSLNLQFQRWMEEHEQYGISGGLPDNVTFDADNWSNPEASKIGRRYAQKWKEMREHNIGILFHGPNSTGKSFHAGMIVNALLKNRVRCLMTSFPSLLAAMEKWGGKQDIINHLGLFELVVIDDLGAERESGYSYEQIFHIVDARYRQRKPLIVTTNIPAKALEEANDVTQRRIFSRVLEMCPIRVALTNGNQRQVNEQAKKRIAEQILRG